MKAPGLYKRVRLFSQLTNKLAPVEQYRALGISPETGIRGCALFGAMRLGIDLGLDREVFVDADDFVQILRSLPDQEFQAAANASVLRWECGTARGHLALIAPERCTIPLPEPVEASALVGPQFARGLELGALSCGLLLVRTLDLEGVQLRNRGEDCWAYASDSYTLSAGRLGAALPLADGQILTFKREAVDLLVALAHSEEDAAAADDPPRQPEILFGCSERAIYCVTGGGVEAQVNQVAPLRHDVAQLLEPFLAQRVQVPLNRQAVASFLRRAEVLAETQQRALVEIGIDHGRTVLRFDEASGSTEEYYLVEGQPVADVASVRLEAHRMAKALANADRLVFDYADRSVLVLRGHGDDFIFGICGKPDEERG